MVIVMNNVTLRGRLVQAPYVSSYGHDGRGTIAMMTLAVPNKDIRDKNGDNPCDFIKCVCFNGLASVIDKYADKGTEILVTSGRLSSGQFQKDGETIYTTEVVIEKFEFGNNKREASDVAEKKSSRKSA